MHLLIDGQMSINRYLLRTYVRMYEYLSFCSHTRVFGVVSCMNLTQYSVSEYNYLVNEYICLIRKKEKVKLDSYRWGLKLQCHVRGRYILTNLKLISHPFPEDHRPSTLNAKEHLLCGTILFVTLVIRSSAV